MRPLPENASAYGGSSRTALYWIGAAEIGARIEARDSPRTFSPTDLVGQL
jgi:hypothetical protein